MSINRVNLTGNLTRDPELRQTPGGTAVLSFGIAVNDRRRNANGEWEDYPNFIDCVIFGGRAEPLSRFLSKGSKVALEGKLRWSSWERDGQKRSKIEVIVDEIEFMSARQNNGNNGSYGQSDDYSGYAAQPAYSAPAPAPSYNQGYNGAFGGSGSSAADMSSASSDVFESDIPF